MLLQQGTSAHTVTKLRSYEATKLRKKILLINNKKKFITTKQHNH